MFFVHWDILLTTAVQLYTTQYTCIYTYDYTVIYNCIFAYILCICISARPLSGHYLVIDNDLLQTSV